MATRTRKRKTHAKAKRAHVVKSKHVRGLKRNTKKSVVLPWRLRMKTKAPAPTVALTVPVNASALTSHAGDMSRTIDDLFQHGVLIDLKIGFWSAAVRNAAEDLGVDPHTLAPMIKGLGTKRLVPEEISEGWINIVAKARYLIRRHSFPFPIADVSFVPLRALPIVERELLALQAEFVKRWRHLVDNLDTIVDSHVRRQPEQHRSRLRQLVPKRDVLRSRFYFTFSTFTVAVPKKVRVASLKRERMEAEERARLEAQARYRAQLEARVGEFVSDAVKTLRAKTVDICQTIVTKIVAGEVVTNRSLNMLRGFVERFKELNFFGDDEIEARLVKLQREVLGDRDSEDFDADDPDGGTMLRRLQRSLEDVQQIAENVTDLSSAGLSRRRVVL